ncbi:hypothetical protein E5357_16485 [Hominisplanchenecus murintestinalis]|uniref:Uncharacterized protein n=1 Tax=Hominisplanchenecus murintestinalis TaxID=2941517 RepID=A0AC61QV07_9FIRM|nr:LPD28 domain-containing protein [Hominisplanchenecus murintestinalis]TGX96338.1 hypothetical protein E5357_16485 [Hominisplanchenecus murintestinalis]
MEIKGVRGYFCDLRIDRTTVPNSFDFWELADGDSDGTPCRYKFGILVNFFGTFITTGRLPVDDMEYGEGYINSEDEWGFFDGSYSFSEIEEMEGCTKSGGLRFCTDQNRKGMDSDGKIKQRPVCNRV